MDIKDVLIEVFKEAGKPLHLTDIYIATSKKITRPVFEIYYGDKNGPYKNVKSFESTIRNALQDNSSDSKNFHRGNGDLFKKVNLNSRDGFWDIR